MRLLRRRSPIVAALGAAAILTVGALLSIAGRAARSLAATPTPVACAAGTDITTASGPVWWITTNGVNEWLGLPYAAPPVGSRRW